MEPVSPRRGDVWWCEFDPVVGREQAGRRPAVVVSAPEFLESGAGRAAVVPLTTKHRSIRTWVAVTSGDLRAPSWAIPDQIRTVDFARLKRRMGRTDDATLAEIARVLRLVLDL